MKLTSLMSRSGPTIRTRSLEMIYGEGPRLVRALSDLNLVVPSGQFICVMGPSGSGKSTLLHLMAGLQLPTSGEIRVGETDIHTLSLDAAARWRRRNVGIVHQFFNLIPSLSVVQNIALPLLLDGWRLRQVVPRVDALLERLNLSDRKEHPIDGLSGGEMQRIAIARALIAEPGLILADEPTGNLDSRMGAEILSLLHEISRERKVTAILMTHDRQATSYADRVLVLQDGGISEDTLPSSEPVGEEGREC